MIPLNHVIRTINFRPTCTHVRRYIYLRLGSAPSFAESPATCEQERALPSPLPRSLHQPSHNAASNETSFRTGTTHDIDPVSIAGARHTLHCIQTITGQNVSGIIGLV